jgi:disulfide bond formation protein DsbB
VGGFCIIGSIVTPLKKVSYGLAGLFTVGGLSVAIRQLWVIAYPKASCGLDPLETFINQFQIVQLLPFFFQADGLCSAILPPILGLPIPIWSLLGFISFGLLFITLFFKNMRQNKYKKTLSNHL